MVKSAAVLFVAVFSLAVLSACGDGTTTNAAGHSISLKNVSAVADFGPYRVQVQEVYAARAFEIPYTLSFFFSRSPAEVARIHRARGYRAATQRDWERFADLLREGGRVKDPDGLIDRQRAKADADNYENVVFPNGRVGSCREAIWSIGPNRLCPGRLSVKRSKQLVLAQRLLDETQPGCRIDVIDPPGVVALSTQSQNAAGYDRFRLRASVACP